MANNEKVMFNQAQVEKVLGVLKLSDLLTAQYGTYDDLTLDSPLDDKEGHRRVNWNSTVKILDDHVFALVSHMANTFRLNADWFGEAEEEKFLNECGWIRPLPDLDWERQDD